MFVLNYRLEGSSSRRELDDFVMPIRMSARAFDKHTRRTYVVGRVAMDRILWAQAIDHDQSLFEVCDNDSQGMHEMHVILTKGGNDLRRDFKLDEPVDYVLFLHRAVFHPDIHPFRSALINEAINTFGGYTLTATWDDTTGLSDKELSDLGFRRVAGSHLLVRHSVFRNVYEENHPQGPDGFFDATPKHQKWVVRQWNQLERGEE
jgi:hypothetical protein